MFLSPADVEALTGRKQPAAQRRWLARNGVRFYVRADGRPAVPAAPVRELDWFACGNDGHPAMYPLPLPPAGVLTMPQILALPSGEDAENVPGLYFMLLDAEVVYIGMSGAVAERLYHHWCERRYRRGLKVWTDIRALHCDRLGIEEAETRHIRHYLPRFNVKDCG